MGSVAPMVLPTLALLICLGGPGPMVPMISKAQIGLFGLASRPLPYFQYSGWNFFEKKLLQGFN
jgi:hypothetical protein